MRDATDRPCRPPKLSGDGGTVADIHSASCERDRPALAPAGHSRRLVGERCRVLPRLRRGLGLGRSLQLGERSDSRLAMTITYLAGGERPRPQTS